MKIGIAIVAFIVLTLPAMGQNPIYDHSFTSCPSDASCTVTDMFKVAEEVKDCCLLAVTNGDDHGTVRGAEIVLNGKKQILDKDAQSIVSLRRKNKLNVIFQGDPHKLRIRIAPFTLIDACDLISRSREHSGTVVAVKGVLYSSFEEFVLLGNQCLDLPHSFGIWVDDPGELSDTPKDVNAKRLQLRITEGRPVKMLKKFLNQKCAESRVAVTLFGYFEDSSEVVTDLPDGSHVLAGFGHMDMYHSRLVLASVEDAEPLPCSEVGQR